MSELDDWAADHARRAAEEQKYSMWGTTAAELQKKIIEEAIEEVDRDIMQALRWAKEEEEREQARRLGGRSPQACCGAVAPCGLAQSNALGNSKWKHQLPCFHGGQAVRSRR